MQAYRLAIQHTSSSTWVRVCMLISAHMHVLAVADDNIDLSQHLVSFEAGEAALAVCFLRC